MTEATATASETGLDSLFVKELVKQLRAQDTHGVWDGKSDLKLLEPFIVDKAKRRAEKAFDQEPAPAAKQEVEIVAPKAKSKKKLSPPPKAVKQ